MLSKSSKVVSPREYYVAYEVLGAIYAFKGDMPRYKVYSSVFHLSQADIRKALRLLVRKKMISIDHDLRDGEDYFKIVPGFETQANYRILVRGAEIGRKEALERV